MADTNNNMPPIFALDLTTTAPTIASAENKNANQPNVVISLVPDELIAASTPPTNNAKIAARKPIMPPIRPKTNSVVRTYPPLLNFDTHQINTIPKLHHYIHTS